MSYTSIRAQASVTKIIKRAVGDSVQVGKEAKVCPPPMVCGSIKDGGRRGLEPLTIHTHIYIYTGDLHPRRRHLHPLSHRLVRTSVRLPPPLHPTLTTLNPNHSANDMCREGRRTTISANDVYQALRELDFEEFVGPLQTFLASE